jgi:hypothetical protein
VNSLQQFFLRLRRFYVLAVIYTFRKQAIRALAGSFFLGLGIESLIVICFGGTKARIINALAGIMLSGVFGMFLAIKWRGYEAIGRKAGLFGSMPSHDVSRPKSAYWRFRSTFARLWDLLGMIFTEKVRERIWDPMTGEDLIQYSQAMKKYRTKRARAWIRFCFILRTFIRFFQTLWAIGLDKVLGFFVQAWSMFHRV